MAWQGVPGRLTGRARSLKMTYLRRRPWLVNGLTRPGWCNGFEYQSCAIAPLWRRSAVAGRGIRLSHCGPWSVATSQVVSAVDDSCLVCGKRSHRAIRFRDGSCAQRRRGARYTGIPAVASASGYGAGCCLRRALYGVGRFSLLVRCGDATTRHISWTIAWLNKHAVEQGWKCAAVWVGGGGY